MSYTYNTFKIIDHGDAELEASDNPFAMAILTAKLALSGQRMKDEQLFDKAYDLAKRLLKKQLPKDKIRKLMTFLRYYVRFENQDIIHKFEQQIAILTEKSKNMGIEEFLLDTARKEGQQEGKQEGLTEGKQEGLIEGKQEGKQEGISEAQITFTKNLLISSDFDIKKIAELVGVTEGFVLNVKKDLGK